MTEGLKFAIILIGIVAAAYISFRMGLSEGLAKQKRSDLFWHVRFIADGLEDDLTLRLPTDMDPDEAARAAVNRYCINMKKKDAKILTKNSIPYSEYSEIRLRLYSKLNQSWSSAN